MLDRLLNSNLFFLAVEAGGLVLAITLAAVLPRSMWMVRLESMFVKLANHRSAAVFSSISLVVISRLILLPIFPVPTPGVHDEYSYLLNGATFASGHLSNPASPMWQCFETFHTLQQPNYVSMYPVAQGGFLAIGFILGTPWLGVLLSVALFCGATTWALQGVLPCEWAFLGGLLAVLKFGLVSYWIDSYWGGAVPALGGALIIGAAARLLKVPRRRDAIWLAFGILLLANSRPFEGLVLLASVVGWFLYQIFTNRAANCLHGCATLAIPAGSILVVGAVAMGYYFRTTTGDVFTMPYVRYAQEYSITKPFLWNHLRPEPVYHNAVMRQYYERELKLYWRARTFTGWASEAYRKVSAFIMFYLWPGALLVFLALPRMLRTWEGRFAVLMISAVLAGISFEIWPMMLHYPSPVTTAALLLLVCAIREARRFVLHDNAPSRGLVLAVPLLCVGALLLRIAAAANRIPVPDHGLITYLTVAQGNLARQHLISVLSLKPGGHLVIVRYGPAHDLSHEWVFNDPSIVRSQIIWARELDRQRTHELIRYFRGRNVWLLQPDTSPEVLSPYRPLVEASSGPLAAR